MRAHLIARSFVPYAARFLARHPNKLGRLRQYWRDYVGRFGKIAALTGQDIERVEEVCYELECKEPLFREINGLRATGMHPLIYYAVVRLAKPDVIVETGVMEGFSSRFILLAMERNRHGTLHSIDLPNQDVELSPGGPRQRDVIGNGKATGWLVPEFLKGRWQLHLGDARVLLPDLLSGLGSVDVFIHDSLHTYEHMTFEFKTAWPSIKSGGLLFSDDVDYNRAFFDFAREVGRKPVLFNYRVGTIQK